MIVNLNFKDGTSLSMPPRYWSFFLCLAETCGWKSAGTKKPKGWGLFKVWHGSYESADGQEMSDSDAREFSNALNRCFYSKHCIEIMGSVADRLEKQVEAQVGTKVPDGLKVDVSELREALGALMAKTHKGGLRIT